MLVTKTYAGWYECFSYKGNIDKYPISLSLQIKEGYFGEKSKENFNLLLAFINTTNTITR